MGLICFECFGFFGFVGFHAAEHLCPIDLVGVKFRSIDADELRFASYGDTARAAHSCAIDHDGVERCLGRDIVFGGREGNELHHDSRADRDTLIDLFAVDDLLDTYGDDTLLSGRTIVGHDDHFVRPLSQFIAEDEQVFVAGGKDGNDFIAGFLEGFGDRQHRCSAHTAARTYDCSVFLNTRSATERTDYIVDIVTGVECQQFMGRSAYLLNDKGDSPFFNVSTGDGQGHAFRIGVHADDHKVTGTTTTGNKRSFYDELRYIVRKESSTTSSATLSEKNRFDRILFIRNVLFLYLR